MPEPVGDFLECSGARRARRARREGPL